jgi:hypothetical protein
MGFIPEDKGKLAAQPIERCGAEILIEVKRDFAIGARAEAVTRSFQLLLNGFVAVELAVDGDVDALVFAGDGLIASGEIDDAEPRVTQGNAAVGGDPVALPIRTTMVKALGSTLERGFRDGAIP